MGKRYVGVLGTAIALIVAGAALARPRVDRTHPDTADRNTLITLRDGVRADAKTMLRTIARCEHSVPDPYGAGRTEFNQCLEPLLNQDLYKSRFEPAMMVGVLRDLAPGRCAALASGVMNVISELGNEAETWIGDAENPDRSAAALEQADAHDMRSIATGIIKLASARGWKTACSARPYQPSEHHARRARQDHTRYFQIASRSGRARRLSAQATTIAARPAANTSQATTLVEPRLGVVTAPALGVGSGWPDAAATRWIVLSATTPSRPVSFAGAIAARAAVAAGAVPPVAYSPEPSGITTNTWPRYTRDSS